MFLQRARNPVAHFGSVLAWSDEQTRLSAACWASASK